MSKKAARPPFPRLSLVFDQDHGDALHDKLAHTIRISTEVYIVVGFLTKKGIELIETAIMPKPASIRLIAVGHGGLNALEGLAKLRDDMKIPEDNVRIDRGAMAKLYGNSTIYAPMLHTKIYYAERPKGQATAYVGSHNLTENAVAGLNCEAGVRLFGSRNCPEFARIRDHIAMIRSKTAKFDPKMIDRYVWQHNKYLESLRERGASNKTHPIMVIAAQPPSGQLPKSKETVYFEVPRDDKDFERFEEVGHRVNIHIVPNLASVGSLRSLSSLRGPVLVGQIHLSNQTGRERTVGRVVGNTQMDWIIDDISSPIIRKASGTTTGPGRRALQVQVAIDDVGEFMYDYSPPGGYVYKARQSDRSVLSSDAMKSMKSDSILGERLSKMAGEMMQYREIDHIDRWERRELIQNEEWRGTKRLRLKDPERNLPMWYTKYSRPLDEPDEGNPE